MTEEEKKLEEMLDKDKEKIKQRLDKLRKFRLAMFYLAAVLAVWYLGCAIYLTANDRPVKDALIMALVNIFFAYLNARPATPSSPNP